MIFNATVAGGGSSAGGSGWADVTSDFSWPSDWSNCHALTDGTMCYVCGVVDNSNGPVTVYCTVPNAYLPLYTTYGSGGGYHRRSDSSMFIEPCISSYGELYYNYRDAMSGSYDELNYFTILYPLATPRT